MPRTIVAGLDIGTSAIRLVVLEGGQETKTPRLLAQVKKESRGLRRGYITNFEETLANLREVVREAERQAKVPLKSVFLGLGGITLEAKTSDGQISVSKADLEISDNEVKRVIEASEQNLGDMTNRRLVHIIPLSFKLDGHKILGRPEGLKGNRLEVKTLFIHCLNQHLQDLIRVTEAAGLAIEDVVAAPIAASLPTITPAQKVAGCILANIGSQTTSVITFEEGIPVALKVLPIGANDVTNDIALVLRVSIEEAERMKLDPNYAITVKRKLDEIIEARLIDMFELIENHLKKIGRSGLLPAGIVIIGGGAHVDDMEKIAKDTLRLPVKVFDPLTDPYLKSQMKDSAWSVTYGLCLHGLNVETNDSLNDRFKKVSGRLFQWFKEFWP